MGIFRTTLIQSQNINRIVNNRISLRPKDCLQKHPEVILFGTSVNVMGFLEHREIADYQLIYFCIICIVHIHARSLNREHSLLCRCVCVALHWNARDRRVSLLLCWVSFCFRSADLQIPRHLCLLQNKGKSYNVGVGADRCWRAITFS